MGLTSCQADCQGGRPDTPLRGCAGLVLAEFAVEGAGGDAEDGGGAFAVAGGFFEDAEDVLAFELVECEGS